MNPRIHRLLYTTVLNIGGETLSKLEFLIELERSSPERVQNVQQERLRQLLEHASLHVPYYRRILAEAGVATGSGEIALEHFDKIPLLDKSELHSNYHDLKSDDLDKRRWYENSSSGSTGQTAHFIQDKDYADWGRALGHLFDQWADYTIGEPKFVVWSISRDISRRKASLWARTIAEVRNEHWLNARFLSPAKMRDFMDLARRKRPTLILGVPEELYHYSQLVVNEGLAPIQSCAVATNGSKLPTATRPTIQAAFGGEIFDRYGTRELSDVAAECESHMGLHVSPLTHVVEVLRPDGSNAAPGEVGELVVTSLICYSMPLIRYRIEDRAACSEANCSCGRTWALLSEIEGRTRDMFVRRDGSSVRIVESVFYHHKWVREFQVIQEDYEHVRAFVVPHDIEEPHPGEYADSIRVMQQKIRKAMGDDCRVEVELADKIDRSDSGKYRHHISNVT